MPTRVVQKRDLFLSENLFFDDPKLHDPRFFPTSLSFSHFIRHHKCGQQCFLEEDGGGLFVVERRDTATSKTVLICHHHSREEGERLETIVARYYTLIDLRTGVW